MRFAKSNMAHAYRRRARVRAVWMAVLALVALAVLLLLGSGLVWHGDYPTRQSVERSFVVDLDFTRVRKILVRTDATKQIVTMTGDSRFLDQHWNAVEAGLEGPRLLDLKWHLELQGQLRVQTRDPYIGAHDVDLNQLVRIGPDQIVSEVRLAQPTARLLQYEMTTRFERQPDGSTRVHQQLTQEIVTDAPWFAHFVADRRVRRAAAAALANQQQAIEQIIAENRDKRWLLLDQLLPSER